MMTKDNIIHLLTIWEKIITQKSNFVLLYLDDKDWYDVLPFDTEEAMEKFLADHTQEEIDLTLQAFSETKAKLDAGAYKAEEIPDMANK
jgi:hypothetical protein